MAQVDIQRKESTGIPAWAWVILALIVIGIIWWILAANSHHNVAGRIAREATPNAVATGGTNGAQNGTSGTSGTLAPGQAAPYMPLAAIRANPDAHFGRAVSGLATVDKVVSKNGFWVKQDNARLFVVHGLNGSAAAQNVKAGDKVSLTATVVNPDRMQQAVPGILKLDKSTLKSLQSEPAFLNATNLQVQKP